MNRNVGIYVTSIFVIVIILVSSIGLLSTVSAIEKTTRNRAPKSMNIIVDANGNGNYTNIQDALDSANPGDSIYVGPENIMKI